MADTGTRPQPALDASRAEPDSRRRRLVPSERQLKLGIAPDEDAVVSSSVAPPAPGSRTSALRRYARDVNPRNIGGPRLPLVVLGLSALLAHWDEAALRILLPEMRADFGFSLQFLLTVGSALGIVSILLAPAMGYLADRAKRVWLIRIGGLLSNVAPIFQGLAHGLPQLVMSRAVAGVGNSVREPAGFPLMADYYPSRSRARVYAFLGFAGGIGAIIGPSVAGHLGAAYGWRFAVVSLGALATFVTLGLFFLKEPVRGYYDRLESGADEQAALTEQPPVSWGEAWRAAASITTVRRLWYATPFFQVAGVGLALFLVQYYANEFALGPQQRGYIATAGSAVGLAGVLVAAPLADRLLFYRPGRVMIALGALMLLYAGSVLVLVVSHNLWLSVLVGLPLGFGFVAIGPALFTLMSLVVPARVRGLGMQTIAPWQLIGFALMPFIGRAADEWGLRQGMLAFLPLFVIGALILMSSSTGVDRDIRAARAASMADEEARRSRARGRTKMLVCRDVDVAYDGVQVLFNVDFDVEQGEIVALLGTNGAGKSTLLRAIAGVQEASNGAIFLDGRDITHVPPHENAAAGVTIVPGGQGVFAELSVRQNLRAAAWVFRDDDAYVAEATERSLALFPALRSRMNQAAGTLSGGEQQMLTLAQAFLSRPRLLMIDELSLGLPAAVVEQLLVTLREINAQGTTVILVEQSVNVALRVAARAVFMEKGEIHFDGPTADLLGHPELLRSVFMGGAASASGRVTAAMPSARARQQVLDVRGVSVRFGGVEAVRGVSLTLDKGEIVGIVGPNGAGKTTLFDAISGFAAVGAGTIALKGEQVQELPPDARARLGLGRSFQNVRLFPSLTVRENVAVARERRMAPVNPLLAGVWAPSVREVERRVLARVDSLLELLGLTSSADKFANELSTGTRRALDIACVTAAEPEVLLLDEPSSGLAQAETAELGFLLGRVAQELGCAMAVIEHDMPLISSVSHRLVAMHLGQVVASGPPAEVLGHPDVVASYLGLSGDAAAREGGIEGLVRTVAVETPASTP